MKRYGTIGLMIVGWAPWKDAFSFSKPVILEDPLANGDEPFSTLSWMSSNEGSISLFVVKSKAPASPRTLL